MIWGTRDPIVPLSRADGLKRAMPLAQIERVPKVRCSCLRMEWRKASGSRAAGLAAGGRWLDEPVGMLVQGDHAVFLEQREPVHTALLRFLNAEQELTVVCDVRTPIPSS